MLPILLLGVILSEAKNLEDIRMGKEFSKNIRFISTSGSRPHPGHTLYVSDDKLIAGDIMHGVALQLEHPEYCARFDMDKEAAIAMRKSVIEQVKQQGLTMYGMHFPTKDRVKVK